ncbi:hypothetical protein ABEX44_25630 [Priestia megaterium]
MKLADWAFMETFWKYLPAALLVPCVAYFLGRWGSNTDRRLEYRTFMDIDEIEAEYKLKNMPDLKSGTRLIIPHEYLELEQSIKKMIKANTFRSSESKLHYLKVKVLGESLITSGTVKLKMEQTDNSHKTESWNLDVSLPILEPNEEVFIPINRLEDLVREFYIKEIEVKYRTQSGERMRYRSVRRKRNNETIIRNSYGVKKFHLYYWSIDKNKGRNSSWTFLDNSKGKDKDKD